MKKILLTIPAITLIFLSSCIYFQTINQPTVALPNEIFTVSITVTTEGGEYEPYFGVCLPIGWIIPGDSIQCSGAYNETIYYDSLLSVEQENVSPASDGYYWWVGNGMVDATSIGTVYSDLYILTDDQMGIFSIDYMLGDSYNGVNYQKSNNHQIEIAEEFAPFGLQITVVGDSVVLIWNQPINPSGLLGYNVYRDEQQINSTLIADTTFIDENPHGGLHFYYVASYYNNGNTFLIPYEVGILYGNNLYVSPNGNNSNDGSSFNEALLTIDFALHYIISDSLNPITIYLSQGIFSPSTNGEVYPLEWKNYVSLKGISEEETILDADSISRVMSFHSITTASIKNLTFRNGYSNEGGGVYYSDSSPEFVSVTIEDNYAYQFGGGMYMCCSGPKLIDVQIENNYAHNGGGIWCTGSSPELLNVTIINNSAVYGGGGIQLTGGNAELTNVNILYNSAYHSGGISIHMGHPRLMNVIIAYNSATDHVGAINSSWANTELVNVTIVNNTAPEYGGIHIASESIPVLRNCIFWNNSPPEISFSSSTIPGSIYVSYSDIQGGESGIFNGNGSTVNWLVGNIDEDPLFVGSGDHPYTLSSGSPCIDSGDPDSIYNDPEDPNNLGFALWPAMGSTRNDMGAYGGPNAAFWNIIVNGIKEDESEELQIPTEYELAQNYPNPFNPFTTIQYSLKEKSSVELILYDILGAQVVVLVNEEQDAGYYKVNFNAGSLASGVYLYRIKAGDFIESKKMILMK